MTTERPMFPPVAESVESFCVPSVIQHPASETPVSDSPKPTGGLSRRLMLAGLAAVGIPTSARVAAAERDPILAAIEGHKTARATLLDSVKRHSALDRELPMERCQSSITVWEEKIAETDDPRWIEAERELLRTGDAEADAAMALIAQPPATIQGAIALINYVAEVEVDHCAISWPDGLEDTDGGGPKHGRDWAYYLHKNLATIFAGQAAVQPAAAGGSR